MRGEPERRGAVFDQRRRQRTCRRCGLDTEAALPDAPEEPRHLPVIAIDRQPVGCERPQSRPATLDTDDAQFARSLERIDGDGDVDFLGRGVARHIGDFVVRRHPDASRIRLEVKAAARIEHYRQIGSQCLTQFYRRHYPFDGDETLGIEKRVVFALDEASEYRMQGIIDRIVRSRDGAIEIHDYKTGSYVPSQKALDTDRQLALYQIGLQTDYGQQQPIRLVWHYLARGQLRTSTRSPEQLAALRDATIALIDRSACETEYPAVRNRLCDWCEYKALCPAWADAPQTGWQPASAVPADPIQAPGASAETQLDLL